MRVSDALVRLQDTTAEIRVRGAFLLLALFVVLASKFGLEAILGAFLAGATLKLVDRDEQMTHAFFHAKLEAVGFGVFVPFFFVSTGIKLDVASLFHSGSALARVPLFLAALLLVRGLPALLYRPLAERGSQLLAGGLLQATSLSIPVVAGQIGVDLGLDPPDELRRTRRRRAPLGRRLPARLARPCCASPTRPQRRRSTQRTSLPAGRQRAPTDPARRGRTHPGRGKWHV